jgi:hypothetical protein
LSNSYVAGVLPLACASLLVVPAANALSTGIDWLQLNGFISQTALFTSDNNFFGDTDDAVSFDYREVGLVAGVRLAPDLRFSTQILSRRAGGNDDGAVSLDHAVLSYDVVNEPEWTLGVQAGRMKSIVGWYNEARDMPFTHTGVFLPFSVYTERTRNSSFFQDGAILRGEIRPHMDTLSWHVGYHVPHIDRDEMMDLIPAPRENIAGTDGRDSWSASLVYDIDGGRMRIGLFYLETRVDVDLAGDIDLGFITFPQYEGYLAMNTSKTVLSFEYTLDRWVFVAERARWDIEADINSRDRRLAPIEPLFAQKFRSPAWYYQVVYQLSDSWNLFARYERFAWNEDDMNGSAQAANPRFNTGGLPAYAYYASARTIGAEWWIRENWLLRAEFHDMEGTAWLNMADNQGDALEKYWDLVALQLSFRF